MKGRHSDKSQDIAAAKYDTPFKVVLLKVWVPSQTWFAKLIKVDSETIYDSAYY